jgi:hypothetical protein
MLGDMVSLMKDMMTDVSIILLFFFPCFVCTMHLLNRVDEWRYLRIH